MRERERAHVRVGREGEGERETEGGREGGKERQRQRILSRLQAVSAEPNTGPDPMNHEITT